MGEANNRGTFEERREQSLERQLDEAECIVFLKSVDGKLSIGFLPRDETPNTDSPAMIFAAYLGNNFKELAGEAMALSISHQAVLEGEAPANGQVLATKPERSLLDAQGNIARAEEAPRIILPGSTA